MNNTQKRRAIQKLKDELGDLAGAQVTLLGMAFKPGTDDMREALSTVLATRCLRKVPRCGAGSAGAAGRGGVVDVCDRYASPEGADAAVVVTEWPQLKDVDWSHMADAMRRPVVFDGRNLLEPRRMLSPWASPTWRWAP
ncbi:UDP binding domain-containing protein [Streptomyces sp. NPDC048664]|uniref:UDP binding domain-containing protein n=1 Tax=Streptomyces sp. NPDC048664 TaxID=3154505 RepID=UPI003423F08A